MIENENLKIGPSNQKILSLFSSWKKCEEIIKSIGKKNNKLFSSTNQNCLDFLHQLDFIHSESHLTEKGQNYFIKKYIMNDVKESKEILTNAILQIPSCYAIISLLYGRKNIKKQNIFNLLLICGCLDANTQINGLSGFIMLLNYCKIITYSKKTGDIKINYNPHIINDLPNSIFISPETPFSNLLSARKIIRKSSNYIYWVSKHLGKKVLEILNEEIDRNNLNEIKLITSINLNEDLYILRKNFKRFKVEMENNGIKVSLKILTDKKIINGIHDRWIITENFCYNIPPMNSLLQGQHCEILKTEIRPPFNNWWNNSFDIIDEWNKILEKMKS